MLKKYGVTMHTTPTGKEGYEYTAEQVYDMVRMTCKAGGRERDNSAGLEGMNTDDDGNSFATGNSENSNKQGDWDNHSPWGKYKEDTALKDAWNKRIRDAAEAISIKEASTGRGELPLFAKRLLEALKKSQLDWRTLLLNFIQEEICDYSFCPPDRRFGDNPFFLPDFNEKEDVVSDILFMVDTSGSISDKMIATAYSEIKGAIDQFNGRLKGWLGFFDSEVKEPIPFTDEEEFKRIKPMGGGGTDFYRIFEYVTAHMQENLPTAIIILTDGYAPFPPEGIAEGIPVLWIINNEEQTPDWGKVARIEV